MSQINVDNIKNRLGSGAPSFPNGIDVSSGVTTFTNGLNVGTGASVFSPGTNELALGTNSAERVRINSGGDVGINDDSPTQSASGNDPVLSFKGRGSSYAGRIDFKDSSGNLDAIVRSDNGILLLGADPSNVTGSSAITFSTDGGERARILSGGGLTFNGDTAAANALDDYEEGDFTPTWQATTNSGTWAATGRYTKIGRLVTVEVKQTSGTVSASAQDHIISGLPFQPFTGTTGSVGSMTDSSPLLNGSVLVWSLTRFYTAVAISSNSGLRISITYMTDD